MVTIFGYDVDLLSLIPAIFGAILSIYNWLKMRQPADIYPIPFVNYGVIASEYQGGMLLCFPLIFSNEGARKGLITEIKIGFRQEDGSWKYLDLDGKARLQELGAQEARLMDWEKFEQNGYVIQQPMYPIVVGPGESEDVFLIARSFFEDKEMPVDQKTECRIEVTFNHHRNNHITFPFYLSQETIERDDQLAWISPA